MVHDEESYLVAIKGNCDICRKDFEVHVFQGAVQQHCPECHYWHTQKSIEIWTRAHQEMENLINERRDAMRVKT